MDASHLHLLANHLPAAFGFIALLVAVVGLIGKNSSIKKLALGLIVLTALSAGTAYFTGKSADIYDDSFAQHERLERHEALGQTAWIVSICSGVVALLGLGLSKRMQDVPSLVLVPTLVLHCVVLFLFVKTANMGGQIFHPETRDDGLSKFLNPG
jgi:uncharacterized membrane protein